MHITSSIYLIQCLLSPNPQTNPLLPLRRHAIILILWAFLAPVLRAQNADSVAVAREVDSLVLLCWNLTAQEKYEEAIKIIEVGEKKALEGLGKWSAGYGNCVHNHGRTYQIWGKLDEAEPLYKEAIVVREKVLGKEHLDYEQSLNNLAILYHDRGEYDKAKPLYFEGIGICLKVRGKEHQDYAGRLNNLGMFLKDIGEYDTAEQKHIEAQKIYAKVFGKEHIDYLRNLNNLAIVYHIKGQYDKAEQLYSEAIDIGGELFGKEAPDYAQCLNNLGAIYYFEGEYDKAELLYLEAQKIFGITFGKESLNYAANLDNLAVIYEEKNDLEKAEKTHLDAQNIRRKILGTQHPEYAVSLNNLAVVYYKESKYEDALQKNIEAKNIREKNLGKGHPDYWQSVHNLANIYNKKNDFKKSDSLYLGVDTAWGKILGETHPYYLQNLSNWATLYQKQGNYKKAEDIYLKVKSILEKTLGVTHPSYAENLFNLAVLYYLQRNYSKAQVYFIMANEATRTLLQKAAQRSSERAFLQYAALFQSRFDGLLSFTEKHPSDSLAMVALNNTLFLKSALLEVGLVRKSRVAQADSLTRDRYSRWNGLYTRITQQEILPIAPNDTVRITSPNDYRDFALIDRLEKEADALKKEIAYRVPGFDTIPQPIFWQQVYNSLKQGAIALEFLAYVEYDSLGTATGRFKYAALLLRPGANAPQFIPLCDQTQLEAVIDAPPKNAINDKYVEYYKKLYDDKEGISLYKLLWEPLEPLLKNTQTIYYAPDGLIHRLNLDAIRDENRAYLGKRYRLVRLGSTRRLALSPVVTTANNQIVLFGGIPYGADSTQMTLNRAGTQKIGQSQGPFSALDGIAQPMEWGFIAWTKEEVKSITKLAQNNKLQPKLYTGYAAVEDAIKQVGQLPISPRVLHLATHGYFFPDPKERAKNQQDDPIFIISEHPLIRSGLIFAGANHAWKTGKPIKPDWEDGILTAYEVAQMNLVNTELVVLSACETGLGDIKVNEGVYGLQRAFKAAGAKYILMSLWSVPDEATQQLMTAFYTHWLQDKMDIPTAFRKAQEAMKSKYPGNPYYWAGFVLME